MVTVSGLDLDLSLANLTCDVPWQADRFDFYYDFSIYP